MTHVDSAGGEIIPTGEVHIEAVYFEGINASGENCRCECCEYQQIVEVAWTLRALGGTVLLTGYDKYLERESAEDEKLRPKDSVEDPCVFRSIDKPGKGLNSPVGFLFDLRVAGQSRLIGSGGVCGDEIAASCDWSFSANYIVTEVPDPRTKPFIGDLTKKPEDHPCTWPE